MTVFAQQAGYRFVNMIDRLTSDNYFLATSSRIPCSGKIRKARGHVGRESFWFPDGKALAGCCCRSKFSRLAPRRDYIADSISVSLALIIRQTKTRYTRIPLPVPALVPYTPPLPVILSHPPWVDPLPRSSPIFPPVFFFSNGAESFRSCRRITENTISSAVVDRCPDPRYLFSISKIFLLAHPLATFTPAFAPPSPCYLFMLDFLILKRKRERERENK